MTDFATPLDQVMSTHVPFPIDTHPSVRSAATLWRHGAWSWATVVAKATFRLVHDGVAELVEPLAIVTADRYRPTGSLEQARETAPYLPEVGVLVSGHAYAPAERACGGPDNPVGVPAGSSPLPNVIDPADPRRPGSFGPIAGHWPARRALLQGLDPAVLEASIAELPSHFDWRYFQAAPVAQRIEALRGGEWLVLDGMNPTLARVQTKLPEVGAHAEWRAGPSLGAGRVDPIDLYADMLVIDMDLLVCSVVWRGRFPLARKEALEDVRVVVDVEAVGSRGDPVRQPNPAPTSRAPATAAARPGASDLDPHTLVSTALPFRGTGHDLAGTLPLEAIAAPREQHASALPPAASDGAGAAQVTPPAGTCSPSEALAATVDASNAHADVGRRER